MNGSMDSMAALPNFAMDLHLNESMMTMRRTEYLLDNHAKPSHIILGWQVQKIKRYFLFSNLIGTLSFIDTFVIALCARIEAANGMGLPCLFICEVQFFLHVALNCVDTNNPAYKH